MKTILINSTTCIKGGGIQVSSNLIEGFNKYYSSQFKFVYCVSSQVNFNLKTNNILPKKNYYIFEDTPSKILYRPKAQRIFDNILKKHNPVLCYTIFGPSYIKFKCYCITGVADPWLTHSNKFSWTLLTNFEKIKRRLLTIYKLMYLKDNDELWIENGVAKPVLEKKLGKKKISIIPNSVNSKYLNNDHQFSFDENNLRIFILSADYNHKNLNIIYPIIKEMIRNNISKIKFVLTLPEKSSTISYFKNKNDWPLISKYIENLGPLDVNQCINQYKLSSIIFLPSNLECYSAVYAESLIMNRILLVSDLDFNKTILNNCVLYFKPNKWLDAYNKIIQITKSKKLREQIRINIIDGKMKVLDINKKIDLHVNQMKLAINEKT